MSKIDEDRLQHVQAELDDVTRRLRDLQNTLTVDTLTPGGRRAVCNMRANLLRKQAALMKVLRDG